ncbi:MAG: hypothetical protein P9L92_08225 [Candidatus Electryonea clarkiae]|nr:hypothetical protein [Candidatus Electryonea clarkiae]MDP8285589.1 hypothetical protein [Candidatus Electryonea clarkiae]
MNLAVYVTGHGYGHMTRTMEILRYLKIEYNEVRVHIRAPFPKEHIIEAAGFKPDSHVPIRLDIGLVQKDSLSIDIPRSVEKLEYFYGSDGDRLVQEEANWLRNNQIDIALIDIPPRAFEACALAGVPAFGSTNFSWDWIWSDLADDDPRFEPYAGKARAGYQTCKCLFRTVMCKGLDAFPVVQDVPLVSRISQHDPFETRDSLGIQHEKVVIILSYGGSGLEGLTLPPKAIHDRFLFVVTEPMKDPGEPFFYISDSYLRSLNLRYCDLVRMADIVMSKPGYSTVAECVGNKTAMVYSDRGRFAEYPVIANYIEEFLPSRLLESNHLRSGNWMDSLDSLTAERPFKFPETRTDGAKTVVRLLVEKYKEIYS